MQEVRCSTAGSYSCTHLLTHFSWPELRMARPAEGTACVLNARVLDRGIVHLIERYMYEGTRVDTTQTLSLQQTFRVHIHAALRKWRKHYEDNNIPGKGLEQMVEVLDDYQRAAEGLPRKWKYTPAATETISVGVEYFVDPRARAELFARDPDHFNLILSLTRQVLGE